MKLSWKGKFNNRAGPNSQAGRNFLGKLISEQALISMSRMDFFRFINKRACSSIRNLEHCLKTNYFNNWLSHFVILTNYILSFHWSSLMLWKTHFTNWQSPPHKELTVVVPPTLCHVANNFAISRETVLAPTSEMMVLK